MKMSKFEKKLVNSQKHAEKNKAIAGRLICGVEPADIKNVLETGWGIGM
jgi:hypothetical protein